jgi:tetratricopeptide (TPR) repeat protein
MLLTDDGQYYSLNEYLRQVLSIFIDTLEEAKELQQKHPFKEIKPTNDPQTAKMLALTIPGNYGEFWKEIKAMRRRKKHQQVIEILKECLPINPKPEAILQEMGITYREAKRYQEAIETLKKGLEKDPDNTRLLNELGIAYRENKQLDKAIETLKKGLEKYPQNKYLKATLHSIYSLQKPPAMSEELRTLLHEKLHFLQKEEIIAADAS